MSQAVGEAESYARGGQQDDRKEAQQLLVQARQAFAALDELAAEEAADNDGLDTNHASTALNDQRLALIERAEALLSDLASGEEATRTAALEEIEEFREPFDQFTAEAEAQNAQVAAGGIQAVREANQGALISLGVAFGLLALLIGLAAAALRWGILRPLGTLQAATTALAGNQLAGDIPITSNNEIGAVQRAFNAMTSTIRAQTRNLEQQVMTAQTARAEAEAASETVRSQLEEIEAQRVAMRNMSVPIMPISPTTLVMPLVGAIDTERLREMQIQVLSTIERERARHLLLDITGVPVVDTQVAKGMMQVVRSARLLGVEVVLVGVRPEVAQTIVQLGLDLSEMATRSSLQSGIAYAQQRVALGGA